MLRRTAATFGVLLCALIPLTACGSDDDGDAAVSCASVLDAASYETFRQLAAAGLSADPVALREAIPGARADDAAEVELPAYEQFTGLSDAERAELLSAVSSRLTGVGAVFDVEQLYTALDNSEVCEDFLTED